MTTTETRDTLKTLALLKNDGATPEIRDSAARDYTALKARLAVGMQSARSPAYWRK